MAQRLMLTAAVLAVSSALAACGSDDKSSTSKSASTAASTTATTTAEETALKAPEGLIDSGKFTACMDISFPPMEYYPSGDKTPKGFDVATIKAVAEAWGVEAVYKNTGFDGLLPALSSGRCDVAWSAMFVNPERTKTFPAVSYYETGTVLLVAKGNPKGIHSTDDLAGKTLVAQTGTTLLKDAKTLAAKMKKEGKGTVKVQAYPKATDLIQQLVVGRADAALTQDTEAGYRDKQNPGQFEVGYEYPEKETFGIYTTKAKADLGDAIKEALLKLDQDGTLKQIAAEEGVPATGLAVG